MVLEDPWIVGVSGSLFGADLSLRGYQPGRSLTARCFRLDRYEVILKDPTSFARKVVVVRKVISLYRKSAIQWIDYLDSDNAKPARLC